MAGVTMSREASNRTACEVCGRRMYRRRGGVCGDCKTADWIDTTPRPYRRTMTLNGNPRKGPAA